MLTRPTAGRCGCTLYSTLLPALPAACEGAGGAPCAPAASLGQEAPQRHVFPRCRATVLGCGPQALPQLCQSRGLGGGFREEQDLGLGLPAGGEDEGRRGRRRGPREAGREGVSSQHRPHDCRDSVRLSPDRQTSPTHMSRWPLSCHTVLAKSRLTRKPGEARRARTLPGRPRWPPSAPHTD